MILVLGLVLLVAAVIVAVAGVLGNAGSAHALTQGFAVLGYHVTGSTGTLFLSGIVVGVVAVVGLSLVLASARYSARRGRAARRALRQSRRETAAANQGRDDRLERPPAAGAGTTGATASDAPRAPARRSFRLRSAGHSDAGATAANR